MSIETKAQAIAEYPFLIPMDDQHEGRQLTGAAHAAKNMRILLKREYPEVKFSLRSENHAGGDSVRIEWADLPGAPREDSVKETVSIFKNRCYDGQSDTYTYEQHGQGFRQAFGSTTNIWPVQRWPTVAEIGAIMAAELNTTDANGNTLLHRAAEYEHGELMQTLISAGVDVNAVDRAGKTALMSVAERGKTEMTTLLIAHGADVNLQDTYTNKTALMLATENRCTETAAVIQAAALATAIKKPPLGRHDFGAPEPLETERVGRPRL